MGQKGEEIFVSLSLSLLSLSTWNGKSHGYCFARDRGETQREKDRVNRSNRIKRSTPSCRGHHSLSTSTKPRRTGTTCHPWRRRIVLGCRESKGLARFAATVMATQAHLTESFDWHAHWAFLSAPLWHCLQAQAPG